FIYYKNFYLVIFVHATFLFLILFMRELVKDLENLQGDFAQNYRTIPVVYGAKPTKIIITASFLLTLVPTFILLSDKLDVGYMYYYFILSFLLSLLFLFFLWRSHSKQHYSLLHYLLKYIICFVVLNILLLDIYLHLIIII